MPNNQSVSESADSYHLIETSAGFMDLDIVNLILVITV